MRPLMALELIWTGESFATEGPAADEGSFSCVPTEVGPQVGCLAVDLSTARDVTYVLLLFSWVTAWCKKHKSELESYWVVWRDWVFFLIRHLLVSLWFSLRWKMPGLVGHLSRYSQVVKVLSFFPKLTSCMLVSLLFSVYPEFVSVIRLMKY